MRSVYGLIKLLNCFATMAVSLTLLGTVAWASDVEFGDWHVRQNTSTANLGGLRSAERDYHSNLLSNEACRLIESCDYQNAVAKLQAALALSPNLPAVNANLGLALNRLGQGERAIEYLEKAVQLAPYEAAPLLTLGSAYERTGRLEQALAVYENFIRLHPTDPDARMVRGLIDGLRRELAGRNKVATSNADPNDYYAFASQDKNMRWHRTNNTLKVYIPTPAGANGDRIVQAMKDAFATWEQAGCFSFQFVNSIAESDIDSRWTNNVAELQNSAEGGEARLRFNPRGITHCTMAILTERNGSQLPVSEIKAVALHEIGHALGLVGHSPDPNDIMYCLINPTRAPKLSARDLRTLHKINSEVGTTCSAHNHS